MDSHAEKIQVLRWPEVIRRRPAMYLGDTGPLGLMFLARELFDCPREPTRLVVTLDGSALKIAAASTPISTRPREDGKPIYLIEVLTGIVVPLDRPPSIAGCEILDTQVRPAVFRRVEQAPSTLALANAVSAKMTVISTSNRVATHVEFSRGVLVSGPAEGATADEDGFGIQLVPDSEIFGATAFRFEALADMLRDFSLRRRVPAELRDLSRDLVFTADAG
jgi:DNA gyrase subunit B